MKKIFLLGLLLTFGCTVKHVALKPDATTPAPIQEPTKSTTPEIAVIPIVVPSAVSTQSVVTATPATVPPTATVEPTVTKVATFKYVVVKGDCLWLISAKPSIYGTPWLWPLIFKANDIADANLIEPGQHLVIPAVPSEADRASAIKFSSDFPR